MGTDFVFEDEKKDTDTDSMSLMDALKAELKSEVTTEAIRLQIEGRPNFSVRYMPEVEMEKIRKWQKRSVIKGNKEDVNPVRFAMLVLTDTCTGIFYKKDEAFTQDGESMRLNSRELIDLTQQVDTQSAIAWLFGTDSQILAHAARVLNEAGYASDGSTLDASDDGPLGNN